MPLTPGISINPIIVGDNMYEPSEPSHPKLAVQFLDLPSDICRNRQGFKQCKYCSKIICKIHSTGEENCFVQLLNKRAEQAERASPSKRAKRSSRIKSVGPPPSPEVNQTANTTSQSIINWIKQSTNRRTNGM